MADIYVRLTDEPVVKTHHHSDNTLNVDVDYYGVPVGVEILGAIGVEVDGREVRIIPRHPEGDYVDKVTAVLSGYRQQLGPNAISLIGEGVWKSLPLSLGDLRNIAWLLHDAGLLKEAT
jgi:hypothetical protein